jgi:hypothetical protein
VVTHTSKGDVVSGYTRAQWPALCAEVGKLRVSTLDGEILPLATGFATAEVKAARRWRKVVTPMGLEGVTATSSVREDPPVSDGDPGSGPDARGPSRTQLVASLATRLADAVVAGDQEQARALAEELQALQAGPAAPRVHRVR